MPTLRLTAPLALALLACSTPTPEPADDTEQVDTELDTTDSDPQTDSPTDPDPPDSEPAPETDPPADTEPASPCPPDMVLVDDTFCIDLTEAALEELIDATWTAFSPYQTVDGHDVRAVSGLGRIPQAYLSGDEAEAACERAGKRLCSSEEWVLACEGPDGFTWPYGNTYDAATCNVTYPHGHPVVNLFGTNVGVWDGVSMNDPRINQQPDTVDEGGANPGCVSAWGTFDQHGNLHEWVSDADGTFRGGFYADAAINGAGCGYRTTAHGRSYHDYSTGFRCCADL